MVITGASSGIGAATAVACAKVGMDIVLSARRREKLEDVAGQVRALGRRAVVVVCDVDEDHEVAALFEEAMAAMGRVDVVFANAGYGLFASVLDTTDAEHRALFETNYFGTVRCLQCAVPVLRSTPDGLKHLLICSSAASELGVPMFGPYAATKAAQDAIAGAMRAELAHEGFWVTSIHPVGTATEFFDHAGRAEGPSLVFQTAEQVAGAILKAIRRPRAEVWPKPLARWAMGLATVWPGLTAWILRREARNIRRQQEGSKKN
jgi:short-subunit dehydrogenase